MARQGRTERTSIVTQVTKLWGAEMHLRMHTIQMSNLEVDMPQQELTSQEQEAEAKLGTDS